MNEELKPCPFCGAKAELGESVWNKGFWGVECQHDFLCIIFDVSAYIDTMEKQTLVTKWNERYELLDVRDGE